MDKKQLRKEALALRGTLSVQERTGRDGHLLANLLENESIRRADGIYTFVSYGSEADTRRLIRTCLECGKRVAVPRVEDKVIRFYYIHSFDDMAAGCRGILEPVEGCEAAAEPEAVCIVPGLLFDESGQRLGYGGGYYDRFFMKEPAHQKIGIGYDFQIVEHIDSEEFDIPVDQIITDERTIAL